MYLELIYYSDNLLWEVGFMIKVKEIMDMAFSYEDGMKLRKAIQEELKTNNTVTVDFTDVYVFTTMFFNACSGHFVFVNSIDWYNDKIKMINLSTIGKETHKHSIENAQRQRTEKSGKITEQTLSDNT